MIRVLFAARDKDWTAYRGPLLDSCAQLGLAFDLARDHAPEQVDYIVYAPHDGFRDFAPYRNCRAVFCLWAGVDSVVGNPSLTQPLVRMIDPGLTQGMIEWVTGHVLRYHLGIDQHINGDPGEWVPVAPPLAHDRVVAILGLGALGSACASQLAALGFETLGWSRRAKKIENVTSFSGQDGLAEVLGRAEITVLLLPATPQTENILNQETLSMMREGAVLLNPGRGALVNDQDLIAALDHGRLSHATLDAFRIEPLPRHHPFWQHPNITVTPHIASSTRPNTAARRIAENIARAEKGEPLIGLVDKARGY